MLISIGLLGLAAYLCFTFLVISQACKWLALVPDSRSKAVFWLLFLAGGFCGGLILASWQGLAFVGVGLRFGTILGLLAFLFWRSFRPELSPAISVAQPTRIFSIAALLSGISAHLMEINSSFDVESTLLHFWTFIALLIVIGHYLPAVEREQSPKQEATPEITVKEKTSDESKLRSRKSDETKASARRSNTKIALSATHSWRGEVIASCLIGLIMVNIGAVLLQGGTATTTLQTIGDALTRLPGKNNTFAWSVLLAVMVTWVAAVFALTSEAFIRTGKKGRWIRSLRITLAFSAGIALAYWLVMANRVTVMLAPASIGLENVGRFLQERLFLIDFYYGSTLVLILILASALVQDQRQNAAPLVSNLFFRLAAGVGVALVVAAIVGIYTTHLRWCKGGVMLARAKLFVGQQHLPVAVAICEAAIRTAPASEDFYLALCTALESQAAISSDADATRALFQRAEAVLQTGSRLRTPAPNFPIAQGNLLMKWAQAERSVEQRQSLGRKAIEFYKQAIAQDPAISICGAPLVI